MKNNTWIFVAFLSILAMLLGACAGAPTPAADTSEIQPTNISGTIPAESSADLRWFVGLGVGTEPEQVEVQNQIINEYEASHPGVNLDLEVVSFDSARDTLSTEIASGNPPDIVGPVGILGSEAFRGQWLDLKPLIEKTGYDLSQFDPASLELFNVGGQGQIGIPIALYPSMVFYHRDLFDEAGLNYPPQKYGDPYIWPDGTQEEWNFDTYRKVAMLLTVDANGRDATQEGFDPNQIVQYGFDLPYPDLRYIGNYFGAGTFIGEDGKTVVVPPQWIEAWKWYYDGIWKDHFIASGSVRDSAEFGAGFPFNVKRAATTLSHLWFLGSITEPEDWDIAVVPSHNGVTTSNIHADTFRILKDTQNPDEAFDALAYLTDDASLDLNSLYGGMPARKADQAKFFEQMDQQYPFDVNWQVAADGVQFADKPNNESYLPKTQESLDYLFSVISKWLNTPGLDIDSEVETLTSDLQAIWDR